MFWKRLLEFDAAITSKLRIKETQRRLKPFGVFFAHSGDSWFILLALFLIWLFTKGVWHHMAAVMAAGSISLAVIVLLIKFSIRRKRPEGTWGAIYRNTDPHSFPSGHAARTALLVVLAFAFGPSWFAIILLIWAPLVSLARVWMGVHYLSDVLAGIVLGVISGFAVIAITPWLDKTIPFLFIQSFFS